MSFKFGYRTNKYKAKPTDGFPSRLEAAVFAHLVTKEKLGLISEIKRQQTVVLQDGPREMRIAWKVDFSFIEASSGKTVYAEAKGFETSDYKLKLKIWRKVRPATLEIYKGTSKSVKCVERIEVA